MTEMRSTGPRSTIALDAATGGLRMGSTERPVDDPADAEQVYAAYLSLLYAVRGARRGEELPLRSADLDALLAIVGEGPEQIEQRLVELMGCTVEEASLLRRVLLRHRALAASVGVAAGLSLVALVGPSVASATSVGEPATTPSPASSVAPDEQPPLTTYLTTDDGEHVPVPGDWDETPAPAPVEDVVTPAETPIVTPAETPIVTPAGAPSTASSPAASPAVPPSASPVPSVSASSVAGPEPAPGSEVVLGDPMTPIDRPAPAPSTSPAPEPEVVLGEPMTPIDRPAPDSEVVLGEPMTPIDRPEPEATGPTATTG